MGGHKHLYLFLYLLFPLPLLAQVIIRDTIRISPLPAVVATSIPSSTIRLVLTQNGNVDLSGTVSRVLTIRNRFCGDNMTAQINGPVTEVFIPARGPAVEAINAFRVRQSPDFHRSYAFYLDDELVDSLHFVSQCPVSCLFSGHVQTVPLYSSFALGVDDPFRPFDLDHGETAEPFTLKYSATSCATAVWHPNCATTVRITAGAGLGTLIGPDGADLGDQFVGTAETIKQLRFSANGIQPEEEVGEAVVEVSGRGIASYVTFQVRRTVVPIHHFSLLADPDTIGHGSIASIFVAAKDAENQDIVVPPETPVDFFLGAGSGEFGDLAATIQGMSVRGDELTGVRYDEAKVGGVVYIADGENPLGLDPPAVAIGVQLQGQPGISGFTTVAVGCRMAPFTLYKQWTGGWEDDNYDHYVKSVERSEGADGNGVADTTFWKIREKGCALASFAMLLTYWENPETPSALNLKMTPRFINKERGHINWGFSKLYSGISFDRLDGKFPPSVRDGNGNKLKTSEGKDSLNFGQSQPIPLSALDAMIDRCVPAAVHVVNPDRNTGHFVVVIGRSGNSYDIADPGKNRTSLAAYNNKVYGIRFLRGAL